MRNRNRKPIVTAPRSQREPQPIDTAYAAKIRRRTEKLAELVEKQGEGRTRIRNHQRQKAEQQMAKLRSETVQARRLAEHIENLSQEAAAYKHKRKRTMTDTTTVGPGKAKHSQRRSDDKPASSGNQLNFNPLHPSMELPPEQLIRLLGMESKKIRHSRKARSTAKKAKPAKAASTAGVKEDRTSQPADALPKTVHPANRSIQYERCEPPQVFDNGRSGLLVPSLLVGVVAGIAVSGYMFWYQPKETAAQKTSAPVVAKESQKSQTKPKHQLIKRTPAPIAKPAAEQKMNAQENEAWRATVEAEESRLRAVAEQRLSERMRQQQQPPQQTETTAEAVSNTSPLPAAPGTDPLSVTEETVTDTYTQADTTAEAPLDSTAETNAESPPPVPVPDSAGTPDALEPPADVIQPETGIAPEESTAVLPSKMEPEIESRGTTIGEIPDTEPAPVEPAVSDMEPGADSPTETDSVLTPDVSAGESPATAADGDLF